MYPRPALKLSSCASRLVCGATRQKYLVTCCRRPTAIVSESDDHQPARSYLSVAAAIQGLLVYIVQEGRQRARLRYLRYLTCTHIRLP